MTHRGPFQPLPFFDSVTPRGVSAAPGRWVTGGLPSREDVVSSVTPASSLGLHPVR